MIKKEAYAKLLAAYIVIEFILFCAIKIAEQTAKQEVLNLFRYSPILLNFVVIVYAYRAFNKQTVYPNKKSMSIWGIPLALLFTLCADVFLVLINKPDVLVFGYFFFALVQTVYAFYLGITPLIGGIRIFAYILFLVALHSADKLVLMYIVAAWSMTQLIINMIIAWISYAKKKSLPSLLLAVGLTLFLGCDGSIMLRIILSGQETVFYHVICLLVWTCYVPSQVALVTSYITNRKAILLEDICK